MSVYESVTAVAVSANAGNSEALLMSDAGGACAARTQPDFLLIGWCRGAKGNCKDGKQVQSQLFRYINGSDAGTSEADHIRAKNP